MISTRLTAYTASIAIRSSQCRQFNRILSIVLTLQCGHMEMRRQEEAKKTCVAPLSGKKEFARTGSAAVKSGNVSTSTEIYPASEKTMALYCGTCASLRLT